MLTVSGSPMQRCCCASASQTATFRVASSRNTRNTCTSTRARQRLCTATGQSGSAATATVPTLIYFNIPGRGEIARLCFALGGVEYKEKTIPLSEWPSFKPTTPFGQVPLLQIGDTIVAQSAAIDHYAARLGGFIPGDPVQALLADQAYFFVTQDIHAALISPTMKLKGDEGVQKRAEIAAGSLQEKLAVLDKLVASKPGQFIAGDTLSIGDFAIFNFLGMIKSVFWSGIPSTAFDDSAALKEFRNQIANEARVKAFYSKATDKLRVMGYRPDKPL